MIFLDASFCLFFGSLLFQAASSATNASNQVTSNKTPGVPSSTKCHNVQFNNYYSGPPNKYIKAHLIRIENKLTDVQKKLDTMIGNRTTKVGKRTSRAVTARIHANSALLVNYPILSQNIFILLTC